MRRSKVLPLLDGLDPERDCEQIVSRMLDYEFPFEILRATEFGLFKAYCVPEMSVLLDATGQIYDRPLARYENTVYTILGLLEGGLEDGDSRAMVRHMNRVHGHYKIDPKFFRYTLAASVMESIKLIDTYGWRKLDPREKLALFYFYRRLARLMNEQYFDSLQELEDFYYTIEKMEFKFSPEGYYLAVKNITLFVSWYPKAVAPLVRRFALTLLGPGVRAACGLRTPSPAVQNLIVGMMRLRAQALRLLPGPATPVRVTKKPHLFYRHGFEVARLLEFQKSAPVPQHFLKHPSGADPAA